VSDSGTAQKIRRWQRSLRIFDRIASRNAKNRQACHVPLNEEAVNTLHRWREQSGPEAHIFDVATGFRNGWKELLKRARISHFRWHDLRPISPHVSFSAGSR
jgi:integrase